MPVYCDYIHNIFFPQETVYCSQKKREAVIAIIDYTPLWQTMERNNVSQYRLLQGGIDNKTLDSLKKNKNITMATLEKICRIVDCTPNDVVTFR